MGTRSLSHFSPKNTSRNVSFGICDYTRPFPILTRPETGRNSPIERNVAMPGLIRSKFTLLLAAAILFAAGSTTLAQEPLTLDTAIDLALVNNRSAKHASLDT